MEIQEKTLWKNGGLILSYLIGSSNTGVNQVNQWRVLVLMHMHNLLGLDFVLLLGFVKTQDCTIILSVCDVSFNFT